MSTLTGSNLIDGKWTQSPATFSATNPATGAAVGPPFSSAGPNEVDAALRAARDAFDASLALPPLWQAELLEKIAANVMDLGDALLERGQQETALPLARLTGERARTTGQLKLFAQVVREGAWLDASIDTADQARQPAPRPDLRRTVRPRGSVVVFGASNFPFAFGVLGGDTASAIAAGNAVVTKGHPSHPGVSEMMASAVLAALDALKLPKGLFNLLQGPSNELGAALVTHPLTEAVGFTGSLRGGRALFDLAAKREKPIPVYAEMGSVNPIVLLPGAVEHRADAIAKGLAGSITLGVGQFCTKPGLVLLVGPQQEAFTQKLAGALAAMTGGTMLNQRLRDSFCSRTSSISQAAGVRAVSVGSASGHAGITPSLFTTTAETFVKNPQLREEAFGPAALVVACDTVDQAVDCARAVQGSLTASVHDGPGDDPGTVRRVLASLESLAGRVILNGYPTGVEVSPSMVHGGPYPATTDPNSTSVGTAALRRFTRMIAYQDVPDALLPPALQNANPLNIWRTVNGERTKSPIA